MARTLVIGGVRSGKSAFAEGLMPAGAVTYVATAPPRDGDSDWTARVASHKLRRPPTWTTVETGADVTALPTGTARPPGAAPPAVTALPAALRGAEQPVLVDDIGNWLTCALDAAGWADPDDVAPACADLVAAVEECTVPLVLVSPEVGWGVLPATRAGRIFADAQGRLNQRLAESCDAVTLVVAGLPVTLK